MATRDDLKREAGTLDPEPAPQPAQPAMPTVTVTAPDPRRQLKIEAGIDPDNPPPPATTAGTPSGYTWGQAASDVGEGLASGFKKAIDVPAEWLARNLGGAAEGQRVHDADVATRKEFLDKQGNNPYATAGDWGGQLGGALFLSAPVSTVLGPLAAGLKATSMLPAGARTVMAGAASPTIASSVPAGVTAAASAFPQAMVPYAMPLAARGVSLASNALQGAIGADVTGGNPLYGGLAGAAAGPLGYLAQTQVANKLIGPLMSGAASGLGWKYGFDPMATLGAVPTAWGIGHAFAEPIQWLVKQAVSHPVASGVIAGETPLPLGQ